MKVYGYVRVSGDEQKKKDGPQRQRDAIIKFCEDHKLEFCGFYEDLGVSGTIEGMHRPALLAMITSAELDGINGFVVENSNRLARDLIVSEMIFRELGKRGLALYAADLGLYDQVSADVDPSRKLIRQIFAAMAEFEKSSLVLKLRAARERKRRETGRCEGHLGYARTRAGKAVLNLIINSRRTGCSWGTIATLLNRGKLSKLNGTNWVGNDVRKVFMTAYDQQKAHEHHINQRLQHGQQPPIASSGERGGSTPAGI